MHRCCPKRKNLQPKWLLGVGGLTALLAACGGGHHRAAPTTATTSSAATSTVSIPATSTNPAPSAATTLPAAPGPPGRTVPSGFNPTDATFINDLDGWAIGQAPCGAATCTTVVRTRDGGHTWAAIPAPPVPGLMGLRFANANVGYSFKVSATIVGIYSTIDGGATWHPVGADTDGIALLEPGSQGVFALSGISARGNYMFKVTPTNDMILPGANQLPGTTTGPPSLAVHGAYAYAAIAPDPAGSPPAMLTVYDGSTVERRPLPCTMVWTLVLAASGDTNLVVICAGQPASGSQIKQAWTSADAGRTWTRAGDPPEGGLLSSVAATTSGTFLTGGRNVVYVTRDGGRTWPVSYSGSTPTTAAGGFLEVGFVDATHGFAIPVGGSNHEIDLTTDAGHTWTAVNIAS